MLSGESSWQTGFSSVAVGLTGQKQKCWWSAAKIFNPTLIKGMYYRKKTKMNYSTCVCCPGCNMRSDWPLSLPLLATTYLLWDKTPPSHICQLSKGKKTLWKLDASFPIQYLIHTWCFPTPPTLKHQLLSWSYIDEFNWWLLFWTLISVCWPDSPVPNTCQESCTGVFQEAVYALL